MTRWQRSILGLGVLLMSACSLTAPPPPAAEESPATRMRTQLDKLPGAVVLAEPVVGMAYPGERLFSSGAALPLAGGVEVLDPLCDLLLEQAQLRWQGTVRAKTAYGREYDSELASKRLELLQRYLRNRGVSEEQVKWRALGEDGPPLELQIPALNQAVPPSSEAPKL